MTKKLQVDHLIIEIITPIKYNVYQFCGNNSILSTHLIYIITGNGEVQRLRLNKR